MMKQLCDDTEYALKHLPSSENDNFIPRLIINALQNADKSDYTAFEATITSSLNESLEKVETS